MAEDGPRLVPFDQEAGLLNEMNNITRDILENQIAVWTPDTRVLELKLEKYQPDASTQMHRICELLELDHVPELVVTKDNRHANPASLPLQEVFTPAITVVFKKG